MKLITTKLFYYSALCAAGMCIAHQANAAGFQLKEQGARLQGLSYAGATAKADDLSTIFFNPAGMVRLHGDQIETNAIYIKPSATLSLESITNATGVGAFGAANNPGLGSGNGGDAGEGAVVPSLYAMWDLHPDWRFGIAVNSPYGLSTSYDDGWAGRYYALDSSLRTITVSPNLAYRISSKWSVGGGVQIQHAKAKLTSAVNFDAFLGGSPDGYNSLEGDDVGYGIVLGALYQMNKDTRFGVNYRSRVSHTLQGDLKIEGVPAALAANPAFASNSASADLTTPDVLSFGAYHALNKKWSIMADVAFTNWSVFQDLTIIDNNGTIRQHIDEGWGDSYFVALGTEYKYKPNLTLQFGVAYDKSPVDDAHRTFRIPDSDRLWVSTGLLYDIDKHKSLGIGYSHIFADDARVSEDASASSHGIVSGKYDASVDIVGVNFQWKF